MSGKIRVHYRDGGKVMTGTSGEFTVTTEALAALRDLRQGMRKGSAAYDAVNMLVLAGEVRWTFEHEGDAAGGMKLCPAMEGAMQKAIEAGVLDEGKKQ